MYYSSNIFASAGMTDANLASVIVGTINVIITIVSVALVDRKGRKMLLSHGMELMMVSLVAISYFFQYVVECSRLCLRFSSNPGVPAVASVIFYVVGFGIGLGPMPFLLVAGAS